MSDPSRWLDPSSNAPPGARDLLARAPRVPALTPQANARMAAHIAKATAGGAAVGASAWIWKGLFGAGVVGLASVAFVVMNHARVPATHLQVPVVSAGPAVQPVHSEATTPTMAASIPPAAQPESLAVQSMQTRSTAEDIEAPAPRRVAVRSTAAAHTDPTCPGAIDAEDDERCWIDRASRMTDTDPNAALAALHQVAARYPSGHWVEERERVTVMALARVGRTREAHARGEAFLRTYPSSIYAAAVRDLLRTLP